MATDFPEKIFKYPLVQYIPLDLYESRKGNYPYARFKPDINLYTPQESEVLHKKIKQLNINNEYSITENQLAFLIINGYIDFIKYRGYEVFMVGQKKEGKFHLFKITDKYFYKDMLVFSFYDGNTGERIDRAYWKLQ